MSLIMFSSACARQQYLVPGELLDKDRVFDRGVTRHAMAAEGM